VRHAPPLGRLMHPLRRIVHDFVSRVAEYRDCAVPSESATGAPQTVR
jgi:hypothetical protein